MRSAVGDGTFDQRLVGGRLAEDQVCRVSPKRMLRVSSL